MNLKYPSLLMPITVVISLFCSSVSFAQTPENNSKEPKTYYFGVEEAAPPISYKNELGEWSGYCNALIDVLQAKTRLQIKKVPINVATRLTGRGNNGQKLDAECGYNTINEEQKNAELKQDNGDIKFSEPFASTGTTFLITSAYKDDLENVDKSSNLKIGLMRKSTKYPLVTRKFPSLANPNNLVILESHADALDKLRKQEINVYLNNELIINQTIKRLNHSGYREEYSILPGLQTYDDYGIVVYHASQQNKKLLNEINFLLNQAENSKFGNTTIKILQDRRFKEVVNDLASNIKIHEFDSESPQINPSNYQNSNNNLSLVNIIELIMIVTIIIILILVSKKVNYYKHHFHQEKLNTKHNSISSKSCR